MNKVIINNKKEIEQEESLSELRRLNSVLKHKDISEEELMHYGVLGMKWGVRNDRRSDGSSGKVSNFRKVFPSDKQIRDSWNQATKGMSKAKAAGIFMLLGPRWGAKAINNARAKTADPKTIVKKETKALRKTIVNEWAKGSTTLVESFNKQFKQEYGSSLKNRREHSQEYSKRLTAAMEKSFNDIASKHLAGTNYKISAVQGFNDFTPTFEITPKK